MKRRRVSFDEWTCIVAKECLGKQVCTDLLEGYIGLLRIKEVSKVQTWRFQGEDIIVCEKGMKWLSILPQNSFYCITAMMDETDSILLWYIDMIGEQGTYPDGIPYFFDLYLDLVVYSDGRIAVDDMDELEEALSQKKITQEQFDLAVSTCDELKDRLLRDITRFKDYTQQCYRLIVIEDFLQNRREHIQGVAE